MNPIAPPVDTVPFSLFSRPQARGYFASRSQKVHDNFLEILDRLIELAGSLDKEQTRKQVMGRIGKVEDSWAQ